MTELHFHAAYLDQFRKSPCAPQPAVGHDVRSWFKWVQSGAAGRTIIPDVEIHSLPESRVDRGTVFRAIREADASTAACCVLVFAWGGMNRTHGLSAMVAYGKWGSVAERTRAGRLSRVEAYESFRVLRQRGDLPGLGPAYFTKLIHFLMPSGARPGYIMDQWTARSMNLLATPERVVNVNGKGYVTDQNATDHYERFCLGVEQLGRELKCSPSDVEQRLFSEGRGKGAWRNYVRRTDRLG